MVYLAAGIIISLLYLLYIVFPMNEFRDGKKISGILFFIIMNLAGAIIAQWSNSNSWEIVEGLSAGRLIKIVQMYCMFVFGSFYLRGGIIRIILTFAISDVAGVLAELLERVIYFGIMHDHMDGFYVIKLTENGLLQGMLLTVCCFLVCKILNKFCRKFRTIPFEKSRLAKIIACFYLAAGFSPAAKVMFIVGGDRRDFLLLSICTGSIFCGFAALLFREKNRIFQQKNLYLFLQEQMLKEHVRLMEDQIAITRKFRHDIRKHLDMVSYFVKQNPKYETSQQLEEYKSDLCDMYQSLSRGDYCDLQDVNAILYQLEKFCKKNDIAFQAKLKDMDCKCMQAEERSDIFFNVVNWGMITCKLYIEAKRKISVELSGETAAGRSVLALSVREESNTGINKGDKQRNQVNIQENVWLEQMEKSLAKYDGFWKIENGSGINRLIVSWSE